MISQIGFLNERLFVAILDAVVNCALLMICSFFLAHEMRTPEWRKWRSNQLAIGIWCHMFGLSLRTIWNAVLLWLYARGHDIGVIENAYPIAFFGGLISTAGVLCKIRVLSPHGVEKWLWVGIMALAVLSGLTGVVSVNATSDQPLAIVVPRDDRGKIDLSSQSAEDLVLDRLGGY